MTGQELGAALGPVLDALQTEAPDPVARGRQALGRALAWMGRTGWPELNWRFSGLASGQPLELVWRPSRPGLFWTAEPAAPEWSKPHRLRRALIVLRSIGGPLEAASRRLLWDMHARTTQEWPVWVSGRHDAQGDSAKIYLHAHAAPCGMARATDQLRGDDLPMMIGLTPQGAREVYWSRPSRQVGDLWRLRRDPGLAPLADQLDGVLRQWTGFGLDDERGGKFGLSIALDPSGAPLALAAFQKVDRAGDPADIRERLLQSGGARNPAFARLWQEGRVVPMFLTLAVSASGLSTALGFRLPKAKGN